MPSTSIQTHRGPLFNLAAPRAEHVRLTDIAHSLSAQVRFTGHLTPWYSVAEHSVRVSWTVARMGGSATEQLDGLLHAAYRAYIGDLSMPFKRLLEAEGINVHKLVDPIDRCVRERFGLPPWNADALWREADQAVMCLEAECGFDHPDPLWRERWLALGDKEKTAAGLVMSNEKIGWHTVLARHQFKVTFNRLYRELGRAYTNPRESARAQQE